MVPPSLKSTPQIDISELLDIVSKNQAKLSDKYTMISEYRGEREINNDYKGRQLLELIQNADDAGSRFVSIDIDTASNILKVINSGDPFSIGGYRSLLIKNLSTKRKKKYIGNKGLGFRSVLNWSKKLSIQSGGCKVTFSQSEAKERFYELYPEAVERKAILDEFEYRDEVIPFPFFASPGVTATEDNDFTSIEIEYYPEVKDDIQIQISTLRKEVLLFLNHIETISISVDGKLEEFKSSRQSDKISIGDQTWKIFDNKIDGNDPVLPVEFRSPEVNEDESYSLKIAVQKDLSDDVKKLFTFFPTKIGLDFPMVIHGTFELDSSRNRIIETPKNKFLVKELVNLIFKVSGDFFGEPASWNKLRLLNYKENKDTVLNEFGFYNEIDAKVKSLAVLPCLDGKYRNYAQVKYLGDKFSNLIKELNLQNQFPELMDSVPVDILPYIKKQFPNFSIERKFQNSIFKSKIEASSAEIFKVTSPDVYAKWVAIASEQNFKGLSPTILFNDNNELIDGVNIIFTPTTGSTILEVPDHVKIDYINTSLYNSLVTYYNLDGEERSRKLRDKLYDFINIQSFEPAPVLTKIVTSTSDIINRTSNVAEKHGYSKAMLRSLFRYYRSSNRAKESQIRSPKIPIVSATGEIINAKDSFLSNTYPIGMLRSKLLGELYDGTSLVASADVLDIGDRAEVELFLVEFVGVNKFLKLERIENDMSVSDGYRNFVFQYNPRPDRLRSTLISYTRIANFDLLRKKMIESSIPRELFVAWLCIDNEIKEKLRTTSDVEFRYSLPNETLNSHYHVLQNVPSFIKYQLSSLNIFEGYLLNDGDNPVINDFQFDFKHEVFQVRQIDTTLIRETLIQLGAKTDFNDLSITRVEAILKSLPQKDPHGKNARRIYQMAIDRYKEKQEKLRNITGLLLHSTKEKVKQYRPYDQVYYANNIGLPQKVLDEKAILNYPKRAGEGNISKFLSVQTFDNINYAAGEYKVNEFSYPQLKQYLRQIRPYILVHRLQRLKTEIDIKDAIKIVKSIDIVLCDELRYEFNGGSNEAEKYDFVTARDDKYTFLVKYANDTTLDNLRKDSTLSDIVSEIYSIAFDVSNIRHEIRGIFRNDVKDTDHQIIEEFGEENLTNAKSKLEITEKELEFWKIIFAIRKISEELPILEDEADFRKLIADKFSLDRIVISKINYESLDDIGSLGYLKQILDKLQITLDVFISAYKKPISFYEYHSMRLELLLEKVKEKFISALWRKFENAPIEVKRTFVQNIYSFNYSIKNAIATKCKFNLDVDYISEISNEIIGKYGLEVNENQDKSGLYLGPYEVNKAKAGLTGDQINTLLEEERSLLYFKISDDELNRIKQQIINGENRNKIPVDISNPVVIASNIIEYPQTSQPESKPITQLKPSGKVRHSTAQGNFGGSHQKPNFGWTFSGVNEDAKRETGKRSEEDVRRALIDKYGEENVVWLSGFSDHPNRNDELGYDLEFRENKENDWQYVEVKSFYKNTFYFSNIALAFARNNRERYHIYLVGDNGIENIPFTELLDESDELKIENSFFTIETHDYKFSRI